MRGLYAITDKSIGNYTKILEAVRLALKGGAKFIQLRDKTSLDEELLDLAFSLQDLCTNFGAKFIVNDRLSLAIKINADGLHLGKDDAEFSFARKKFKNIIGISCYGDLERAKKAQDLGADYVAFGSFYRSKTKPQAKVISSDIITKAKKTLKIPVAAIGGIDAKNAQDLINKGADLICAINALWSVKAIEKEAKKISACFEQKLI